MSARCGRHRSVSVVGIWLCFMSFASAGMSHALDGTMVFMVGASSTHPDQLVARGATTEMLLELALPERFLVIELLPRPARLAELFQEAPEPFLKPLISTVACWLDHPVTSVTWLQAIGRLVVPVCDWLQRVLVPLVSPGEDSRRHAFVPPEENQR